MVGRMVIPEDIDVLWGTEGVDGIDLPGKPKEYRILVYLSLPSNPEGIYIKFRVAHRAKLRKIVNKCIDVYCRNGRNEKLRYVISKVIILDRGKNIYALRHLDIKDRCNMIGIEDLDILYLEMRSCYE